MRSLLFVFLLAGTASAQVAITGAKVHTGTGTTIENATLVIKDGVIVTLAAGAPAPAGAKVVDGRGKVITPGLIESFSRLGLSEVDLVAATQEGTHAPEQGNIHAAFSVLDGYNPDSVAIPVARAHGVTAHIAVPTGALVSGTSAFILLQDRPLAASLVQTPVALHVTLGEGSLAAGKGSRGGAVELLREVLDDATNYAKRRADFERNQTRPFSASRLDLEALLPAVQGRMPIVIRVDRAADIRTALRLATELKLRLVIAGGTESWLVAEELAKAKIPVMLDVRQNLPGTFDAMRVRDDAAVILAKAGVPLILTTDGDVANVRNLRQVAGIAVARGLPWDTALAAITSVPAQSFGLKRGGTLAVGQRADVVLWSGDPFELSTQAEAVYIDGVAQSLRTRQTMLLERYRTLPRR
jgi:imidazolonepropionase-like amidohydrolase